jgi:5-formyltetrahydrofolate cyclo-ligase
MTPGDSATKPALRARARQTLLELTPAQRAAASARVAAAFLALSEVAAARTVLLFASLPLEPDTTLMAIALRQRGVLVAYPRVGPGPGAMSAHLVQSAEDLERDAYGILAPPPERCPRIDAGSIDVVAVPGLAFDGAGHRLGRGKGYYDRFLMATRALRTGIFFAAQEMPSLPVEPHDIALHVVVSEAGVRRFTTDA